MDTKSFTELDTSSFPEQGCDQGQIRELIKKDCQYVGACMPQGVRGKPDMPPEAIAIETWSTVSHLNPNNGGIHTHQKQTSSGRQSPWAHFRAREIEIIKWMANLLEYEFDEIDGYIISGSTEGNIMGLWSARNKLHTQLKESSPIVTLVARTAHFSIFKAADLLGFKNVSENIPNQSTDNIITSVDLDENYRLCVKSLEERIEALSRLGYKSFIVVATVGSTITGAVDQIPNIFKVMQTLEQRLRIFTAIHVDAAFGGITAPFIEDPSIRSAMNWSRMPGVNSFTLDFHKMGGLPYGCGVYLARRDNFRYVARKVGYTASRLDATLLGSRSGAMTMALWATIKHKGRQGFKRDVLHARHLTLKAAARLKLMPKLSVIEGGLNHIGLCLNIDDPLTSKIHHFLENEAIFGEQIQRNQFTPLCRVYPLYFMPDISETDVYDFLNRLETVIYEQTPDSAKVQ